MSSKSIMAALLALAGLTTLAISQGPGTYTPSSSLPTKTFTNPNPYLGSSGRRGPPLSTALPTSGPLSQGVKLTAPVSTPRRSIPSSSQAFTPPVRKYPQPLYVPPKSLVPEISGRSMSQRYMNRAIYSGVILDL